MKRLIHWLTILLFVCVFSGCQEKTPAKEAIRMVRALQVSDPANFVARWFPGQAKATQEVDLSFRVAGPLIERPINVGDEVPRGQKRQDRAIYYGFVPTPYTIFEALKRR